MTFSSGVIFPFFLDFHRTKYAVTLTSFFHELYFERYGILGLS
jgi:hypothetical protein